MNEETDPMLSLPDAAALLGIPHTTLWRRVKAGELPAVKVGNSYGVRKSVLMKHKRAIRPGPKGRPRRPPAE